MDSLPGSPSLVRFLLSSQSSLTARHHHPQSLPNTTTTTTTTTLLDQGPSRICGRASLQKRLYSMPGFPIHISHSQACRLGPLLGIKLGSGRARHSLPGTPSRRPEGGLSYESTGRILPSGLLARQTTTSYRTQPLNQVHDFQRGRPTTDFPLVHAATADIASGQTCFKTVFSTAPVGETYSGRAQRFFHFSSQRDIRPATT